MGIAENIKRFFKAKENKEPTGDAPDGICPNCWGTIRIIVLSMKSLLN